MKSQVGIWKNLIKFALMMKRTLGILFWCKTLIAIYVIQSLMACANIVPPTGGPRDSIPAYRVYAKPKDSSTQVQPKEIIIAFNEYINVSSIQENLIVSPTLKNMPLVESKLNSIRIRINDSLAKNTTYRIQFGEAIKDVNEGNITPDFSYVFSTGENIDTGRLMGTVNIAETGNIDSTLIVVLQPAGNDTAIFKNRPLYYSKVNGKGKFSFDFLPSYKFDLFVLPNDYTKRYDDSTKMFAFYDSPIEINKQKDSIRLYAFQGFPKKEKIKSINKSQLKRNTASLKYMKNLEGNELDILSNLQLSFETPVHLNDSFPIILTDTFNKPYSNYSIRIDTNKPNTVLIDYPWKTSTAFHLMVPKNAIQDSLNNYLIKTDTIKFITKPVTYYGSCIIRINGYDQYKNPLLLLTQDDKIMYKYPITQNLLRIEQLPPGDFQLKILVDENKNGKWDSGSYGFRKPNKQPEKVLNIKTKLNIKSDWENEINISLNK